MPIALVAVLALAAFISAGLWFMPNNAQAQERQPEVSVDDIDVGENLMVSLEDLFGDFERTSDDTISATVPDGIDGDTDAEPVQVTDPGGLTLGMLTFTGTDLATALETQAVGGRTTGTLEITVSYDADGTGSGAPVVATPFTVTIVQNPIERSGEMVTNPDGRTVDSVVQPFRMVLAKFTPLAAMTCKRAGETLPIPVRTV